jgi:hypothetical protein
MSTKKPEVNLWQFEARAGADSVKSDLELTCMLCNTVLCDIEHGDTVGTLVEVAKSHACVMVPGTCVHCQRPIVKTADGTWIDPEATGDDSMWRETCADNHEDRIAAHEPEEN